MAILYMRSGVGFQRDQVVYRRRELYRQVDEGGGAQRIELYIAEWRTRAERAACTTEWHYASREVRFPDSPDWVDLDDKLAERILKNKVLNSRLIVRAWTGVDHRTHI